MTFLPRMKTLIKNILLCKSHETTPNSNGRRKKLQQRLDELQPFLEEYYSLKREFNDLEDSSKEHPWKEEEKTLFPLEGEVSEEE